MPKNKKQSVQYSLFTDPTVIDACPDTGSLPLIIQPDGRFEVMAPGSIYQPILLTPAEKSIMVGPGKLEKNEEKFVRDFINYLYPAGNPPKSEKTPLKWDGNEVWLKRNIEKDPCSFRLRVDDSDWFYPDFIVWILDHRSATQTLGFVDPKGLAIGAAGGWSDYKIVSTLYMPHVVEMQLADQLNLKDTNGKDWKFCVRGAIISTTAIGDLKAQAKFRIHDENGAMTAPAQEDFEAARILFQNDSKDYIKKLLHLLTTDTKLDGVMKDAAMVFHAGENFQPTCERHYELLLRLEGNQYGESEFVSGIIQDYLKPDKVGNLGNWAEKSRRNQLIDYSKEGRFGFGGEKAADIRDRPNPCEELWKRKRKSEGLS